MQADMANIFGISPRPISTEGEEFDIFFLSSPRVQPPSALYNRVCKSSQSGRVKQSSRNRALLSRSADFLYSIDGNPLAEQAYLDPEAAGHHDAEPLGRQAAATM